MDENLVFDSFVRTNKNNEKETKYTACYIIESHENLIKKLIVSNLEAYSLLLFDSYLLWRHITLVSEL